MTELSIKAKCYDEALEKAKIWQEHLYDVNDKDYADELNYIFPELKESEDERIRKAIIEFFKLQDDNTTYSFVPKNDIIAWLEKQKSVEEIVERYKNSWYNEGKIQGQIEGLSDDEKYQQGWHDALEKQSVQKPVDKVEPKFHEGEWITDGEKVWKIGYIEDDMYIEHRGPISAGGAIKNIDKHYHLWTIQDAKDGDVLAFDNDTIVIFKDLYNATTFHSYCYIEDGVFDIGEEDMPDWWEGKGFHPATKEQCDLLFSKMKEAGYEWDAEKQELKKIEQMPQRIISAEAKEAMYDKPAWSEEDEHWRQKAIDFMKHPDLIKATPTLAKHTIDWLKSLRTKNTWKPSDEQMDALNNAILLNEDHYNGAVLSTLREQLKKLRKE